MVVVIVNDAKSWSINVCKTKLHTDTSGKRDGRDNFQSIGNAASVRPSIKPPHFVHYPWLILLRSLMFTLNAWLVSIRINRYSLPISSHSNMRKRGKTIFLSYWE